MAVGGPSRVYEDFDPPSDLVSEQGLDIFRVYLPAGFKKDQLRVRLTTSRLLEISGECQIGDNKWKRFHKELRVPANCDTKHIIAKFDGGILYIRLPNPMTRPTKTQPQQPPLPEPQPQHVSDDKEHAKPTPKQKEKEKEVEAEAEADRSSLRELMEKETVVANQVVPDKDDQQTKPESGSTDASKQEVATRGSKFLTKLRKKPQNLIMAVVILAFPLLLFALYILYMFNSFIAIEDQHACVFEFDPEL